MNDTHTIKPFRIVLNRIDCTLIKRSNEQKIANGKNSSIYLSLLKNENVVPNGDSHNIDNGCYNSKESTCGFKVPSEALTATFKNHNVVSNWFPRVVLTKCDSNNNVHKKNQCNDLGNTIEYPLPLKELRVLLPRCTFENKNEPTIPKELDVQTYSKCQQKSNKKTDRKCKLMMRNDNYAQINNADNVFDDDISVPHKYDEICNKFKIMPFKIVLERIKPIHKFPPHTICEKPRWNTTAKSNCTRMKKCISKLSLSGKNCSKENINNLRNMLMLYTNMHGHETGPKNKLISLKRNRDNQIGRINNCYVKLYRCSTVEQKNEDYGIEDVNTDDSTDNEDTPKKKLPDWVKSVGKKKNSASIKLVKKWMFPPERNIPLKKSLLF